MMWSQPGKGKPAVRRAVELIESMPAWSDVPADDLFSRRKIIDVLKELAMYDLDILRKAIRRYISRRKREDSYDVSTMSRLYLLNRYIFNVPNKVPLGLRRFAAFFGMPYDSQWINELWPLSTDEKGEMVLTGEFRGYFGEVYLALEEFDHFRERYGLRRQ
jgi:hypothetical protein